MSSDSSQSDSDDSDPAGEGAPPGTDGSDEDMFHAEYRNHKANYYREKLGVRKVTA